MSVLCVAALEILFVKCFEVSRLFFRMRRKLSGPLSEECKAAVVQEGCLLIINLVFFHQKQENIDVRHLFDGRRF
jgi:hypothetical protein